MTEYNLRSSEDYKVNAPSIVAYAVNAFLFARNSDESEHVVSMVTTLWPHVPYSAALALVSRQVPYGTFYDRNRVNQVVFEWENIEE